MIIATNTKAALGLVTGQTYEITAFVDSGTVTIDTGSNILWSRKGNVSPQYWDFT